MHLPQLSASQSDARIPASLARPADRDLCPGGAGEVGSGALRRGGFKLGTIPTVWETYSLGWETTLG